MQDEEPVFTDAAGQIFETSRLQKLPFEKLTFKIRAGLGGLLPCMRNTTVCIPAPSVSTETKDSCAERRCGLLITHREQRCKARCLGLIAETNSGFFLFVLW